LSRTQRVVIILGLPCSGGDEVARYLVAEGYEIVRATMASQLRTVSSQLLAGGDKKVLLDYPRCEIEAEELLKFLQSRSIRVDVCLLKVSKEESVRRQMKLHEEISDRPLRAKGRSILEERFTSDTEKTHKNIKGMIAKSFYSAKLNTGCLVPIDASKSEEAILKVVDQNFGPAFVVPEKAQVAYS